MDKTFRDILTEFLEGNEEKITSETDVKSPFSTRHSTVFEPLWRPDFEQNPSREGLNRYRVHVTPPPKVEVPPVQPAPAPPPEVLFPLEKLPSAASARVRELIGFGATNLTQGLSRKGLKKAHRLLARKFHPDRMTGATPEQVRLASAKFIAVQAAFDELMEFLLESEQDMKAAA